MSYVDLQKMFEQSADHGAVRPLGGGREAILLAIDKLHREVQSLDEPEGDDAQGDEPEAEKPKDTVSHEAPLPPEPPASNPVMQQQQQEELIPLSQVLESVWQVQFLTESLWGEDWVLEALGEGYGKIDEAVFRSGVTRAEAGSDKILVVESWQVIQGDQKFWVEVRGTDDEIMELEPSDAEPDPDRLWAGMDSASPAWNGAPAED